MNEHYRIGQPVKLIYMDCPRGVIAALFADAYYLVRFPDRGFSKIYHHVSLREVSE